MTSYKSGIPLVTGRSTLSRSFRNPYEPAGGTSVRSSHHPYPRTTTPAFDSPPCLVARDKRDDARAAHMTADLRQLAAMESGSPFGTLTDEAYLSWEARKRRQGYYYLMCILCLFPFIAPLVYRGTFDAALSWYTRGETASLTRRQRRNVLVLGVVISGVWVCALVVFVTVVVSRKQQQLHM